MSRIRLFIHFVILLRVDRPYMATIVYRGIQLIYHGKNCGISTARGFDVAHAK